MSHHFVPTEVPVGLILGAIRSIKGSCRPSREVSDADLPQRSEFYTCSCQVGISVSRRVVARAQEQEKKDGMRPTNLFPFTPVTPLHDRDNHCCLLGAVFVGEADIVAISDTSFEYNEALDGAGGEKDSESPLYRKSCTGIFCSKRVTIQAKALYTSVRA